MPRCQCGAATCACSVVGGDGIDVTGVGTQANPYRVKNLRGDALSRLQVIDTDSVDLTIAPVAPDDPDTPYTLQADATVSMMDLTDVNGADFPVTGDIPVWDGTQWQFNAPGPSLPVGGADGQVLTKQSSANGDANWETLPAPLPPGGTTGQMLAKVDNTNGNANWANVPATAFQVQDTATLDLSLTGSGNVAAPYVLSGTVLGGGGGGSAVLEPTYAASWRQAAALNTANGVIINIPWDTEDYTSGITKDTGGIFTIPAAGTYQVNAKVAFAANATGKREIRVLKNGASAEPGIVLIPAIASASGTVVQYARAIKFAAGDTVQIQADHTSGVALDIAASGVAYNSVDIFKVPTLSPGGGGVVVERPVATSRQHATAIPAVASATSVNIPWDTAQADDGSIPCSSGIFTIPVDGWYQINTKVTFPFNATGQRSVRIMRNGASADMGVVQTAPVPVANATTVQYARAMRLTAGDTISVSASQSSGGALDVAYGGISYNSVDITKMPQSFSGSAVSTYGERIYASSRGSNVAQSIPNGAWTQVDLSTVIYEDGIVWNDPQLPGLQYRIPVDGYYQVDACIGFAATGTTGYRAGAIYLNSTPQESYGIAAHTATVNAIGLSSTFKASAGQYVTVRAWQNSGGAVLLTGSQTNNFLTITKVPAPVINGAAASGVWGVGPLAPALVGSNDLAGREVYIDSKGQLRAKPEVPAPRIARLKSAVQTLTTASTYYTLTYETAEEPDSGITYAAGVFTFTVAGVYQVNAVQHFASLSGDPQHRLSFLVNGVNYGYAVSGGTSPANSQSLALSRSWRFAAGDTLAIQAYSTQAAQSAYGNASARYSYIDITRIAA